MNSIKKICCIGAGFVCGSTMAVIANRCPHIQVDVVDINQSRIDLWNNSNLSLLPVFEPGLPQIIKNVRGKNLNFSAMRSTFRLNSNNFGIKLGPILSIAIKVSLLYFLAAS